MARVELPTCKHVDPNVANMRVYGNGTRHKVWEIVCYGREEMFEAEAYRYIFEREAVRLMGPPPLEYRRWLADRIDRIRKLLKEEQLGLFSKKVHGDATDWRALAAFANWYWWLTEEGIASLEEDILDGNSRWAEYVIGYVIPNAPAEVKTDPTYASTQAVYANRDAAVYDGQHDFEKGLVSDQAGPWPLALPSGLPATIPGLPMPCEDFPRCVLDAIPMALGQLWQLVEQFAAQTPNVKQLRGSEGMLYRPDPPPEDPVAKKDDLDDFEQGAEVVEGFVTKMAVVGLVSTAAVVGLVWYLAKKS